MPERHELTPVVQIVLFCDGDTSTLGVDVAVGDPHDHVTPAEIADILHAVSTRIVAQLTEMWWSERRAADASLN